MLLSASPSIVIATLLWLAPGILWGWLAYPSASRVSRVAIGASLGLAAQIALAAPLSATVGITRTSVVGSTLALLALAALTGWVMRVRAPRLPAQSAAGRRHAFALTGLLAVVVAVWAAPLAFETVPDGWDPSFHSLLATVILLTGHTPSWRPFEPIASNYPYGAHVSLAEVSLLSGAAPHLVFGALLNIVTPLLTCLLIYSLARRMWRSGGAALGAVAAYGLLGYWNAVDYAAWGGLPNALGFILLLAALDALFAPGWQWRRAVVAGALLSAVPLTHHQVALAAGIVLGSYGVALAALAFVAPGRLQIPDATRGLARRAFARLAVATGVAAALASYAFIPYAIRGARTLGDTSVFADYGEYYGLPFDKNGVVLWLMAAGGVALALWPVWRRVRVTPRGARGPEWLARLSPRSRAGTARLAAALALVSLFAAFIFGQFVFHAVVWALQHRDETAFSPPRFLGDMTYFLALFAGPALVWLWRFDWALAAERASRRTRWAWHSWRGGRASVTAVITRVALIALTLGVGIESLHASGQIGSRAGQLAPGDLAAFTWARAHAPSDALIIPLLGHDAEWAPYFTLREVSSTPLPASEDTAGYVEEKQWLVQWALEAAHTRTRSALISLAGNGVEFSALLDRPVLIITRQPDAAFGAPVRIFGATRVYAEPSLFALWAPEPAAPGVTTWWLPMTAHTAPGAWMRARAGAVGWLSRPVGGEGLSDARSLVMPIGSPLPSGAAIRCRAEDGAVLAVDGRVIPDGCHGALMLVPALSAPGAHTIAVWIYHGQHTNPWLELAVVSRLTPPPVTHATARTGLGG